MKQIKSKCLGIIVGSFATNYWYKDSRSPKDIDIYAVRKALEYFPDCSKTREMYHTIYEGYPVDITIANKCNGLFPIIAAHVCSPIIIINGCPLAIAKPPVLLLIKEMHANYPKKRKKNIYDRDFLRIRTSYTSDDRELFTERKTWLARVAK